jgi:hypothetical protein
MSIDTSPFERDEEVSGFDLTIIMVGCAKNELWIRCGTTHNASLSSSTLQYVIEGEHAVVSFANSTVL